MRAREFDQPRAAGCVLYAEDTGRWGFQQRSDSVSDPGVWSTWGGGRKPGENLEQCVRRELAEEGGYTGQLTLEPLHRTGQYATFIGRVPHEFEPQLNKESKAWCWVELDQLPEPMHPGLTEALQNLNELTEDVYDILEPLHCGPFDGGCVLVAKALQQLYGGKIVVLVDENNRAQHAAVYANDQLIDYDGAAEPKEFVRQFEQKERVDIKSIRPMLASDLPDAPRNPDLVAKIAQVLSENFADGKNPGRKGLSRRVGIPKQATLTQLSRIAKSSTGERRRMAQWQLNMRRGKNKK